ncbi:hypothetical protein PBY51_002224 [Eleginops maclovinus]|uniref:Uncharacterized protein n=1 Tax=Eleginops maclovinus TaxID=56733 RepID=A0AAN7WZJ2_ELEMC|nr:hypothetical protein PBY51_002224 [Eleginops maclovinus]
MLTNGHAWVQIQLHSGDSERLSTAVAQFDVSMSIQAVISQYYSWVHPFDLTVSLLLSFSQPLVFFFFCLSQSFC